MATIQWRPEINALTTPQSNWIRFVPRNVVDSAELAKRMAKALPNYSEEEFRTFLNTRNEIIQEALLDGEQVTEENAFIYGLSFTGRLDGPDDPLPPLDECLQVRAHASPPLVDALRRNAQTERLPMVKKLPLITTAEDSLLKLNDVLNPQGALQLSGSNLQFDQEQGTGQCVIRGTRSGETVQTRVTAISNTSVTLLPDIPAQDDPWNNEYTVSVSTHYSAHGTLRIGTYGRMLRSPLTVEGVNGGHETGILSGSGDSPLVSITDVIGTSETLRIQAVLDLRADTLLCNLIDMKEGGEIGPVVLVSSDGEYTLQGFSGSAVTDLTIRINSYSTLKDMVRNEYSGRLVDILDVRI